jgi:non-specific serine/threonine protein kinase
VISRIGHYDIETQLGEGGMGVVYAARDSRLGRRVAIKTLRGTAAGGGAATLPGGGDTARERLWREARAAAAVNHPGICQVHEVGEHDGHLYIVMELLEGEPLAARIERGALPVSEALDIAASVLGALDALHRRDLVHRDLKPSNVFLTPHGVKLLDFGLVRPLGKDLFDTDVRLTMPGMAVGTPRYMAPEMWAEEPVGPPADLFAVGAILFEMLTGDPAFGGNNLVAVYHAILHEQPPALSGGPDVLAVDRILQRALAKRPQDRYASATDMLDDLRAARAGISSGNVPSVRTLRRLIVLPLRVLRPDPETDFLAWSLPEALTASLSGLESLVVRSSVVAGRFDVDAPDLQKIAAEAAVDAVVCGTLLRAGDQVRVATQLVDAPGGTLVCSRTSQVKLQDVLQLQDELVREIAAALSVSLTAGESQRLRRDVPGNARAYEMYLRANRLAYDNSLLPDARDLYRACLDEDPSYAPAWARLGRVYRVMAKYGHGDAVEDLRLAEEAFRRALQLDPDLPLAHSLYTYFEVEEQGRSVPAMVRLLERARTRTSDADLFAGLVLVCRFCGLLEASVAADRRARRIDPGIGTSVHYTYWMMGDWERAMQHDEDQMRYVVLYTLPLVGREAEAAARYREQAASRPPGVQHDIVAASCAAVERRREACVEASTRLLQSSFHDPEGLLFVARNLARVGETALALSTLDRVIGHGFYCTRVLGRDPWLDGLRAEPRFAALVDAARRGTAEAAAAFRSAGGEKLLGVEV